MDWFIGEIRLFPWLFAPKYWAICNGAQLPIAQNQALFSLLGTQYGGNGQTTFALPNFRGRGAIHWGNGIGLSPRAIGEQLGTESHTLSLNETPTHTHGLMTQPADGNSAIPAGHVLATASPGNSFHAAPGDATLHAASVSNIGGQSHPNMQPFLVLNYCIATQGIFPSRN